MGAGKVRVTMKRQTKPDADSPTAWALMAAAEVARTGDAEAVMKRYGLGAEELRRAMEGEK